MNHRKTIVGIVSFIIAASVVLAVCSCGRQQQKPEEKAATPTAVAEKKEGVVEKECLDFSGTWDTNRGDLTITQTDCTAEGTLAGTGGGYYKVEGAVTENTFDFSWKGPAGRGRGYLTLDKSADTLSGELGEGDNTTGKGKWDGFRKKEEK